MLTLKRPDGNLPEDSHLSRRGIAAMVFAGYAAAALSAEADPIHTDEAGLVTDMAILPTEGKSIRAYVARPNAPGRFPAVIVVNEVFGLHAYILDICRRFAKLGYVAIAPGFFDRAGDPAPLTDFGQIFKIVATASDQQVMGDVATTLKFLEAQPFVNARKIAITGFCWGGKVVWNACETFPDIKAGVAWYGQMAPAEGGPPADPAQHGRIHRKKRDLHGRWQWISLCDQCVDGRPAVVHESDRGGGQRVSRRTLRAGEEFRHGGVYRDPRSGGAGNTQ
jgi:carboxymethylenebutenolidase